MTQPDQLRIRSGYGLDYFSQPQALDSNDNDTDERSNVFVRNNFARFLCSATLQKASIRMEEVLQNMIVPFQSTENGFHFQTVDRRKCPLVGLISIQMLDSSVLVVIKKTRGNPIEYVRFFKFIVDQFADLIQ